MKLALANEQALFNINNGFTITEEFSETLDSASVIISKLNHKINIAPFDFCNILFDNGDVYKSMLVDNYQIKEITLEGNKQYQATIELMSLTKLLEKIQLPNRVINHSLVNGQQTIQTYIEQYCDIYTPKIKFKNGSNWQYKKLFKVDSTLFDDENKFNVKCRDMGFSQPTLRQAITNLMLQVGCIPVIKADSDGELYLSYIDFNATQSIFNITDNSSNYTNYSNASDSKVNNLIVMADNILDDENVVVNESVGFRDKDSVLLKQESNLKISTRLPIYSIDKVLLNWNISSRQEFILHKSDIYIYVSNSSTMQDNVLHLVITNERVGFTGTLHVESLQLYVGTGWSAVGQNSEKVIVDDLQINYGVNEFDIPYRDRYMNSFAIFGTINGELFFDYFNKLDSIVLAHYFYQIDITKLVVENSKRQLLDADFLEMQDVSNIDELAQYVYGTVGYSIGGTEISGFSQTYNKAVAWWNNTYTYLENILSKISYFDLIGTGKELRDLTGVARNFDDFFTYTRVEHKPENTEIPYIYFDISYKPMNSMRLEISKQETIDLPISQLDSAESSIYALNDLAINEQEKVDRLGNEIITINQRTLDPNEIQPLNSKYGEYTIFKRTIAHENDFYKINYVASKNYVIKNYFTSIQTKYRAYEYTSYDSAVIRKENTKVYVLIDKDYINGDDKIIWHDYDNWVFASALFDDEYKYLYKINNVIDSIKDDVGYYNDLSIVDFKNNLVFSWQEFDSVSHGIYIKNTTYDDDLGGLPQQWYIKDDELYEIRKTALVHREKDTAYSNIDRIPILPQTSETSIDYGIELNNTYYADKQEKINQTLQFEYYCASGCIQRTNKMQELCYFKNDNEIEKVYSYSINPLKLIDRPHLYNSTYDGLFSNTINVSLNKTNNSITFSKENAQYIKVMQKISSNEYYDIAIIELDNNGERTLYVSLNDTKSFNVATINDYKVITFNDYETVLNTNDREVQEK